MLNSETEARIKDTPVEDCWKPGTDLANKSTLGVGVETPFFFQPETLRQLHDIRDIADRTGHPVMMVGGGSNVIFTARARNRFLVELNGDRFTKADVEQQDDRFRVDVGAGKALPPLVRQVVKEGWNTFGRLAGIPGTVGGALYGNSGTRKGEIGDFVSELYVLAPGSPSEQQVESPEFRYRWTNLSNELIVRAVLTGTNWPEDRDDPPHEEIQENRRRTQPVSERTAGCMFKNPDRASAGQLIDQTGLKGLTVGDARVSRKHANFIVNDGGASPDEVITLIEKIRSQIQDEHDIRLETEIQIV